ncbi:DUF4760 domain-containing protein [Amycolatopsis plumensis]|uniref:DUF4760 domain-containing protein n=1 Tax=Amycolatopsis plumensis TaxID=236508 RepID=A0ABV5U410_9PSEU
MQVRHAARESLRADRNLEDERRRQRKKDTIDAMVSSSRQWEEFRMALPWNDRDKENVQAYLQHIERKPAARAPVRNYLDFLEVVAVGVNSGVFDIDTVSRMVDGRILAVTENYMPYINLRRDELRSPSLYSELEVMARSTRNHRDRESASANG